MLFVDLELNEGEIVMHDIILALDRFGDQALLLGRVGENRATRISIDLKSILSQYPDAIASITVKQPDRAEYPAAVKQEGGILTWEITRADIGDKAGSGQAQITIQDAVGTIIKTKITTTRVAESLGSPQTPAPDPVQAWVDSAAAQLGKVIQAGTDAANAAKNAETATESCVVATNKSVEATSEATAAAIEAKKAAELAGQLANKNGYFYVEGRADGKLYLITSDAAPPDFTLKDNGKGVLIAIYG